MPKLIFTSHYMKHALPSYLEHYVKYIATREGVDQIDDTKRLLDATENQKKMIQKMLKDFPEAKYSGCAFLTENTGRSTFCAM